MSTMDLDTYAKVLVGVTALVHLSELVHPQCIGFGCSIDVKELYLHEHAESVEAFKIAQLLLFNLGCYNLCVCIMAFAGLLLNDMDMCLAAMMVFAANAVFRAHTPAEGTINTLVHLLPPVTVIYLYYTGEIPNVAVGSITANYPGSAAEELAVIVPAVMHFAFFIIESVLFPHVKLIQKLFIGGKAAADPPAVSIATGLLFQQGIFNLALACLTYYSYYYMPVSSENGTRSVVVALNLIYVGAAIALMYSAPPKQAVGGIAQGGPPLYALYMLFQSKFA